MTDTILVCPQAQDLVIETKNTSIIKMSLLLKYERPITIINGNSEVNFSVV